MALSNATKSILANPTSYLYLQHNERKAIKPEHIWKVNRVEGLTASQFTTSVNAIRSIASRKGKLDQDKELVQDCLFRYAKEVSTNFKNINQLNTHLKGIFGCELPHKYRNEVRQHMNGTQTVETTTPPVEAPPETVEAVPSTSFTIGGVEFTLSKGASLNIGMLETKTLDFKGMKSVAIERVEDGRLFGINLQS